MGLGLEKPDDFKNDAYGYLTNQIGHIFIGFTLVSFYCFVLDKIAYFPDQIVAICVVVGAYLFWWELMVQGWRGYDTFEDTFFFAIGSAIYIPVDFYPVIDRVVVSLVIMWVPLLVGTYKRL
jgi:hypothetical protein